MAGKELENFNKDIRAQMDDAIGHRESPRLIQLLKSLVRFTNSPSQNEEMDKAEPPKPVCPHDVVNRKTGRCVACNELVED